MSVDDTSDAPFEWDWDGPPESPPQGPPQERQAALQEALAAARRENAELREKYLRAAAEIENTRKQAERDAALRVNRRLRGIYARLLEVADNLERAVAASSDGGALVQGVQATLRQLLTALRQEGVTPIAVQSGEAFDPLFHEAVTVREADVDRETVAQVLQNGYLFDGQVLRPARVVVAVPARRKPGGRHVD